MDPIVANSSLNDKHIVHRLMHRIASREPSSSPVTNALQRANATRLSRQAKQELFRAALLEWLNDIASCLDGAALESPTLFWDFALTRFPENRFPPVRREDLQTIRRLQRTEDASSLATTPEEARLWLQARHVSSLQPWYRYLLSADAAEELKDIPWFRTMVLHTISTSAPHLEVAPDRQTHQIRQVPRKPDTRDLLPECDPGTIAATFDKLYDRLTKMRYNAVKKQQQFFPNWDVNIFELYAEASRESKEAHEQFKDSIKPNSWLQVTDPEFLAAASVKTPWCLRSRRTARHFLTPVDGHDAVVFVYFDEHKNPGIGVHAVRVNGNQFEIRQLRGADDQQELTDPSLVTALAAFVTPDRFVNAATYKEQISDHRALIALEEHMEIGTTLPVQTLRSHLVTLYNARRRVKPFGFSRRDDRQQRLLVSRKPLRFADMETIFGAGKVAASVHEARERDECVAYLGDVREQDFFKILPERITHIHDALSDKPVHIHTVELPSPAKSLAAARPSPRKSRKSREVVLKAPPRQTAEMTAQVVFLTMVQLFGSAEARSHDDVVARARHLGLTIFSEGICFLVGRRLHPCPFPIYKSDIFVSERMIRLDTGRVASGMIQRFLVSSKGEATPEEMWGANRRLIFLRRGLRKDEVEHLRRIEKTFLELKLKEKP